MLLQKISKKVSYVLASIVLMTAQMTPFFVFGATKVGALDTGYVSPAGFAALNAWDVNTIANVSTSDNVYISDNGGATQGFSFYNQFQDITSEHKIDGISLMVEARSTDPEGCRLRVNLSKVGGDASGYRYIDLTDEDQVSYLGGSIDLWGLDWTPENFYNQSSDLLIYIQDNDPGGGCENDAITYVDYVGLKVFYSVAEVVEEEENDGSAIVCEDGSNGWTKIKDGSNDLEFGTLSGLWGDITWGNSTGTAKGNYFDYDVTSGYELDICIKSGKNAFTNADDLDGFKRTWPKLSGVGSLTSQIGKEISHVSYRYRQVVQEEPHTIDVTIRKYIDTDGDGVTDRVANDGEFEFKLNGSNFVPYSGGVNGIVFEDVPVGNHTITESNEDGYVFYGSSGDPCVFPTNIVNGVWSFTVTGQSTDMECSFFNRVEPTVVDYCDPSDRPAGMSIGQWLDANDVDGSVCFEIEPIQVCGSFDALLTNNTGLNYEVRYVIGETTPSLDNWQGNGVLPATFSEDQYGGSVKITYYVVGEESDYFKGFGMPNIWDGNGVTVTVVTDCQEPQKATLTVTKKVLNDNGGTMSAEEFTLFILGNGLELAKSGDEIMLEAGKYFVGEIPEDGYRFEGWSEDCWFFGLMQVEWGSTYSCTITNNDIAPEVKVTKTVLNSKDSQDFDFTIGDGESVYSKFTLDGFKNDDATPRTYTTGNDYKAGLVVITEEEVEGWYQVGIECEAKSPRGWIEIEHPFTAEIGKKYRCEVTNEPAGKVIVTKYHDLNRDGVLDEGEPALADWEMHLNREQYCNGVAAVSDRIEQNQFNKEVNYCYGLFGESESEFTGEDGNAYFENLKAGWYDLSETQQEGWEFKGIHCDNQQNEIITFNSFDRSVENGIIGIPKNSYGFFLGAGETVNCYVLNTRIQVDLEIDKDDAGVTVQAGSEFNYTIDVKNNNEIFTATEVVVTDELDDNLRFVSYVGDDWSCELTGASINGFGGTLECEYQESLDPLTSAPTITVEVEVSDNPTVVSIVNVAEVTSKEFDSDSSNNTDIENTPVSNPQVLGDSTTTPNTPQPQVLGATTTLATTGDSQASYMFATGMTLIAATILTVLNRKRETVSTK